jgi:septal ring factor EnvC (AmiA/AmiB activator)
MARSTKTKDSSNSDAQKEKKLANLCKTIAETWGKIQGLQSELKETNRQIAETRQKLESVQAERDRFNALPEVIEARRLRDDADQQIAKLQSEVSQSRRLEGLLIIQCRHRGINPDWVPPIAPDNSIRAQYEKLLADERMGKAPAGSTLAFYRTHRAELRAHVDSEVAPE